MLSLIRVSSVVTVTVALEGDWSNLGEKGFINKITDGIVNFNGAFNIKLLAPWSGGIVALFTKGTLNIQEAIGKVTGIYGQIGGSTQASDLVG